MSDKESSVGAIAAIVALVGACSLCALGPALLASVVAGATSWFSELALVTVIALGLVAAFAVHRLWRAWGARDQARTRTNQGEAL